MFDFNRRTYKMLLFRKSGFKLIPVHRVLLIGHFNLIYIILRMIRFWFNIFQGYFPYCMHLGTRRYCVSDIDAFLRKSFSAER